MNRIHFVDTMIAAKDYQKVVQFYRDFLGLDTAEEHETYIMLVDREKKQRLCITDGAAIRSTSLGINTSHLETAIQNLEKSGGKVLTTWEHAKLKGAHCQDPEGNDLMIWQNHDPH